MDRNTFKAIVEQIVQGFEDQQFQADFAQAQHDGDVEKMMALPAAIQNAAFADHGCQSSSVFKEAGREHATDPEILALLGRMKSALR